MTEIRVLPFCAFSVNALHCVPLKLAQQSLSPDSIMGNIQLMKTILYFFVRNIILLCNFQITPKQISMSGQCMFTIRFAFSTLKQKMRQM